MSEKRIPIRINRWLGLNTRESDLDIIRTSSSGRAIATASPSLSNIEFFQNGWQVRNGTTKVNTSAIASTSVNGIYDGFNDILVAEGTNIRRKNGAAFDTITGATSMTAGAVVHFVDYNGLDICVNGAGNTNPKSWDGTTFQDLAGSPPKAGCIEVYQNRVYLGALGSTLEDEVRYSGQESATTWTGAFIRPGKRQRGRSVVALKAVPVPGLPFGALAIFCADAIFHFEGFTEPLFSLKPVQLKLGCVSPRGVAVLEGITYWLDESGIYASGDGGVTVNNISWNIQPTFTALNKSRLNLAIAQAFRYKRQIWFSVSASGSNTHDTILVYNAGLSTPLEPPWSGNAIHNWSLYSGINVNSMAEILSGNDYTVYGGDSTATGFVRTLDSGTDDDGTTINWRLKTGRMLLRDSFSMPSVIRRLSFVHDELAGATMQVKLFRDMTTVESEAVTIDLSGGAFVLGQSLLGSGILGSGARRESPAWFNRRCYAVQFEFSGGDNDKIVKCYEAILEVLPMERAA